MIWNLCFFSSVVILLSALIAAAVVERIGYRSGRVLDSTKILFVGVVVAGTVMFLPIYSNIFEKTGSGVWETLLISIHNMIRLFVVDGEFEFITENLSAPDDALASAYAVLFAVLFVLAPVLTFGFVLSFFKNFNATKAYLFAYFRPVCIFSELNERSLTLAKSLRAGDRRRVVVFTDVFEKEEEESFELVERAKELGAIRLKKDVLAFNFGLHAAKSKLLFFIIGQDETENIVQTIKLAEKYKDRGQTELYVFSTHYETELLLESIPVGKIRLKRKNEVQSLIYRNLYENGEQLFRSAADAADGEKRISALIVGMGKYGTEMLKALSWFCQMSGYRPYLHAFDRDPGAEDRFRMLCPELMDPAHNGRFDSEEDARYEIRIHGGTDVFQKEFTDTVAALPVVTYVFVALGSDELNIRTAVTLRTLFERMGVRPVIQAVVCNPEKRAALNGVKNHKQQSYDVSFIGDLNASFSEKVILASELEEKALQRHLCYAGGGPAERAAAETAFWTFDYNYRSSIASVIHKEMKVRCGIPGIELPPAERTEAQRRSIRMLEHRRWNAYVRSEGYVYGEKRNDLGKTHPYLVPFSELPADVQAYDDD